MVFFGGDFMNNCYFDDVFGLVSSIDEDVLFYDYLIDDFFIDDFSEAFIIDVLKGVI